MNSELLNTITVYADKVLRYSWLINLPPGVNVLRFHSKSPCDVPYIKEEKEDYRCLSICLTYLSYKQFNGSPVFSYWYPSEKNVNYRHMPKSSQLIIYNPLNNSVKTEFSFIMSSFYRNRTLEVLLNGKTIGVYVIPPNRTEIRMIGDLLPRMNKLVLESKEGCDTPAQLNISSDTRCISFTLYQINTKRLVA